LTNDKLLELSATQVATGIAGGDFSSQDYTRACLERIEAAEPVVHAFVHIDPEHALRQARACDEWRQSG
jgi:aspartyl-tRNA(Asn)/glutamyl-tRNA(Gln) amidotransferase subunit A